MLVECAFLAPNTPSSKESYASIMLGWFWSKKGCAPDDDDTTALYIETNNMGC
jgi:hypothetical protein